MTYVLNNADVLPVAVVAETKADRPGLMQRIFAALLESRMRSATRELRARNLLVNEAEIVLGGFPSATLSSDVSLPFNR
ncbi:hypothetical protein [Bosea sp. ANAM02]|uniref:hypothetical protein n=1 Tax=Bosea sp. ANAM02 TaxID=2020412 RepID=UPI0006463F3A|nr:MULTISPECIES: hypothetical protein [Hyphomicrobiales]BCB19072.1 hypothetical protein OCUBac02_19660 [Bosea sp. ANAM02]